MSRPRNRPPRGGAIALGLEGGIGLFVGATLGILAITLLAGGRRRPEDVLAAVFLGLVAVNFLTESTARTTGEAVWRRVAFVALALDPWYLLLFTTGFPYPRRPPAVRALLAATGASTFGLVGVMVLAPGWLFPDGRPDNGSAAFAWLIANLVVAYLAAWLLCIRGALGAPSPALRSQGRWVVVAVGLVAVTRFALLPADFDAYPGNLVGPQGAAAIGVVGVALLALGMQAVIMAGGLFLGRAAARVGAPSIGSAHALDPAFRLLAVILGALLGLVAVTQVVRSPVTLGSMYPLRWVLVAGILVHGLLDFEVLGFRRAADRSLPLAAAVVGGLGLAIAGAVALGPIADGNALALPLLAAVGAACIVPVHAAARHVLRQQGPGAPAVPGEQRLEVFRGSLEGAWADGAPDAAARRRLDRQRRALGLSLDEARTLEHLVSSGIRATAEHLRPGDEPVPGLLLERLLSDGSQGRVYAARDLAAEQHVAVKEFLPGSVGDAGARRALAAEFQALRALRHPHVARHLDMHVRRGKYLLVTELVAGKSLKDAIARGPLPEREVRRMAVAVLGALEAVHARGLVHRDLKPANIMLGRGGEVKVVDFGIAAPSDPPALDGTVGGYAKVDRLSGTLAYMAPEQARGEGVDARADLYSLGLVVFEALTGRHALGVEGLSAAEALLVVADPAFDAAAFPPRWAGWFARALAPNPADRFPTAEAMRQALPGDAGDGRPRRSRHRPQPRSPGRRRSSARGR